MNLLPNNCTSIQLSYVVNACIVAFICLSIQVMKCMIKSLPLQRWHLASRAIKQLKDQIIITAFQWFKHWQTLQCVIPHTCFIYYLKTPWKKETKVSENLVSLQIQLGQYHWIITATELVHFSNTTKNTRLTPYSKSLIIPTEYLPVKSSSFPSPDLITHSNVCTINQSYVCQGCV